MDPIITLTPDSIRVFFKYFIASLGIIFFLGFLLGILQFTVGLDIFVITLEEFGITLDYSGILFFMGSIYLGFLVLLLAYSFMLKQNKFEFYQDRLVYPDTKNIFLVKPKELPFRTISRLYIKNDFLSSLVNLGTIVLDLTGDVEEKKEIPNIPNPEFMVKLLDPMING